MIEAGTCVRRVNRDISRRCAGDLRSIYGLRVRYRAALNSNTVDQIAQVCNMLDSRFGVTNFMNLKLPPCRTRCPGFR